MRRMGDGITEAPGEYSGVGEFQSAVSSAGEQVKPSIVIRETIHRQVCYHSSTLTDTNPSNSNQTRTTLTDTGHSGAGYRPSVGSCKRWEVSVDCLL